MNEVQVKKDIQALVDDFKSRYSYYKSLSETDIETKLIYELFVNILGWDRNDFKQQEKVRRGDKRGRADYGFYIGDRLVFFLEVKKIGVPLDKEADKQVISYALSKRVPFAISTNFEQMKIFCVEEADEGKKIFRVFNKPEDYIEKLQDLLLLAKESFEQDKLLTEAIKEERLKKRVTIDKPLLDDLMSVRRLIANDIEKSYPQRYEANEKDEIVQRIIDRLIFIRRCEDTGINPENCILKELKFISGSEAYKGLKKMFDRYNETYNSGLFASGIDNDCDNIKIDGNIIRNLVGYLYNSKDGQYIYNFDWIDADVLGQIYEQYLGLILEQTKSGKSKLKEGQAHKKEQGIYYTPTDIVEFIIKNTLGELLKDKKVNPNKIKILDPSCGSGSFLIKSFDYLNKELSSNKESNQHKLDEQGSYSAKTEIIKHNLYGVDLDNKAIEITKLNLLLKASEKNRKLPEEVDLHIKHGNSLMDEESIDKSNYFRWDEKFPEIIQYNEQGILKEGFGFDVLIGNPPWVSIKGKQKSLDLSEEELSWLFKKYPCDQYRPNLFEMFIWRALSLVKEGGYFGFIVPDRLCYNGQFLDIREYILKNFTLKKLWFKPLFAGVISDNIIFVIKKEKSNKRSSVELAEYPSTEFKKITQEAYASLSDFAWFNVDEEILNLFDKIKQNPEIFELGKKFRTNVGFIAKPNKVVEDRQDDKQIKVFKGKNILKFGVRNNYYFDFKKENLAGGTQDKEKLSKKNKVFLRKTGIDIMASFDDSGTYPEQSVYFIYTDEDKSEEELKVLCALLNSKLLNCFYRNFAITNRDATPQLKKVDLDKFPIILPKDTKFFSERVDKLMNLNTRLLELGDKTTSETKDIKDTIDKNIEEINKNVYNIYGLTDTEIKIIEKFFEKE